MRDLNDAIDVAKSGSDLSLVLPGSVPCVPPYSEFWPRHPRGHPDCT